MIPVGQMAFGPRGDCYAACLASILELSIDQIPDLRAAGDEWGRALRDWLGGRGLDAGFIRGDGRALADQAELPKGWSILGHRDGGRPVHAVVCRDGYIVHDPAPFSLAGPDSRVVLWTLIQGLP